MGKFRFIKKKLRIALLILISISMIYSQDNLRIKTIYGEVIGLMEKNVRSFKGIPFAAPPTGPLRFKAPSAPKSWSPEVREAKSFSPACLQVYDGMINTNSISGESEDCLYLNVWTPKEVSTPLPVMVWIYGGSFTAGTAAKPDYNGVNLTTLNNVIIVSMNYRLGIFGFMVNEKLAKEDPAYNSSGNYGLLDQSMAFQWVKDNINAFGGDPEQVTIFGESAGSISVCYHLLMSKSMGLFKRAILQSGSCANVLFTSSPDNYPNLLLPNMNYSYWAQQSLSWMEALGCKGADPSCIRALPAKTIQDYVIKNSLAFGPVVDGLVIPNSPVSLFEQGTFNKADIIFGVTLNEGSLWTQDKLAMTKDEFSLAVKILFPKDSSEALSLYAPEKYDGSPFKAYTAILGDYVFNCAGRRLINYLQARGLNVYQYLYTHIPNYLSEISKLALGSFHTSEIAYVFNIYEGIPLNPKNIPFNDAESNMSLIIGDLWTNFARSGIPATSKSSIKWIPHTKDDKSYLEINSSALGIKRDLFKERCDFFDKIVIASNTTTIVTSQTLPIL
jgi:para-nitrobenzyl esterase